MCVDVSRRSTLTSAQVSPKQQKEHMLLQEYHLSLHPQDEKGHSICAPPHSLRKCSSCRKTGTHSPHEPQRSLMPRHSLLPCTASRRGSIGSKQSEQSTRLRAHLA